MFGFETKWRPGGIKFCESQGQTQSYLEIDTCLGFTHFFLGRECADTSLVPTCCYIIPKLKVAQEMPWTLLMLLSFAAFAPVQLSCVDVHGCIVELGTLCVGFPQRPRL